MTLLHRNDFGQLFDSLNAKAGVELGVASGSFSDQLLSNSKVGVLHSVDKWDDERHGLEEKAKAEKLLFKHGSRSILIQSSFHDALQQFGDESMDFIYIDGYAHTGQEEGMTLMEWWPKLKPGGVFAGHDYHSKWPKTVSAVNRFVSMLDLPLHLTSADEYPSWYVFKKSGVMRAAEPLIPGLSGVPVGEKANCILVGNGASLSGSKLGPKIDAFDEVLRFNDFVTSGFEADVGTKTTIWCAGGRNKIPSSAKPRPSLKIVGGHCHVVNSKPDIAPSAADLPTKVLFLHGETGNPGYAPKQLWRIPMEHYNAMRDQVRSLSQKENKDVLLPSAGLVAASWLIKNGVILSLAGFDHFDRSQSPNHHYWINRRRSFTSPVEHDALVERELFSQWEKDHKVSYLH